MPVATTTLVPVAQPVDRGGLVGDSRSMPRDSDAGDDFVVQRLRQLGEPGDALGQDLAVHQAPAQLRVGRERVERCARVHRRRGYRPRCATRRSRPNADWPGQCGLERGVVAEVGEQAAGVADEREALAAADRDRDVVDPAGFELLGDAAEPVQVVEADAVELRVPAEQRQRLELADGALQLRVAAARAPTRISRPWLSVRMMSLVGKSWRSRENASAWSPFMCWSPGAKTAPEYLSSIGIGTLTWTPPIAVDDALEAGEVDRHDVRDGHADEAADAFGHAARAALRVGRG